MIGFFVFFFFFQAEDGIRDIGVTGVQTCALPIYIGTALARRWFDEQKVDAIVDVPVSSIALAVQNLARERNKMLLISGAGGSEERRVGKEGRSRWSPYH